MDSLFNKENKNVTMVEDDHFSSSSSIISSSSTNEDDKEREEEVNSSSPTLLQQHLPLKRGLSKYYNGKSKSFTSLSNVGSIEDVVKAENPYNKRMKMYGGLPRNSTCSRLIGEKGPNASIVGGRRTINNNTTPTLVHRSTSMNSFTLLFA